jgi:hypothetical protein
MGLMTYFIFEPPSAQPRDPADSKKPSQTEIGKIASKKIINSFLIFAL